MIENLTVKELVGGLAAFNERAGKRHFIRVLDDGRYDLVHVSEGRVEVHSHGSLEGLVEHLGTSPVRPPEFPRRTADNADRPLIAQPAPE